VDLLLHNSLTRHKEVFTPADPARVTLYVCGPTVYDRAHLGNARAAVVFDTLYRVLQDKYPEVVYARNITDVDDKINQAAAERGVPIGAITAETERYYLEDMDALGVLRPVLQPRVTDHIPQIIALVEKLIAAGHAYEAEGHVLFDVPSMPDYGRLSGHSRDELIAGARVDVAPYKRDPADFVLWKPSTPDLPGWDSPWGRGRPGWHIECSAMIEAHLGETIDIHGGGADLIFPHHENEIAQSTCAHHGAPLARYWLHNGMLRVEGEKMSKSLGNFFTVRDLVDRAPGEAIRLLLLSSHYRQPLDWTEKGLQEAIGALDRFYLALRRVQDLKDEANKGKLVFSTLDEVRARLDAIRAPNEVVAALSDDLNTPLAISILHKLVTEMNKTTDLNELLILKNQILGSGNLLGLLQFDPSSWLRRELGNSGAGEGDGAGDGSGSGSGAGAGSGAGYGDGSGWGIGSAEIEEKIQARIAARKAKDFATADRIRDELIAAGITLEDGIGGTSWRRKS
jgi:cysteinyl-tRNA synthetase